MLSTIIRTAHLAARKLRDACTEQADSFGLRAAFDQGQQALDEGRGRQS